MSAASGSSPVLSFDEYRRIWIDSICEVLSQISSVPFRAKALDPGEIQTGNPPRSYVVFTVGPPFAGEQVVSVSENDALKLAQLLVGEPAAEGATFDADHREALSELFRQIAGAAATSLGARQGSEIATKLTGTERPAWLGSSDEGSDFQISSPTTTPLFVSIGFSPELRAALASAVSRPQKIDVERSLMPPRREPNLEFLRDVELAVTVRFGKRDVLLREVLELTPGAVVELEQRVEEPVELLVGRKVIARGDVVVVEGNYGLRVTEVVGPVERINCLRN